METKQSKVNTLIMCCLGGLAAVAWALAQHTLSAIENSQFEMRKEMMPRHEVELELSELRLRMTEFKSEQQRFDLKLADINADLIRMKMEVGTRK